MIRGELTDRHTPNTSQLFQTAISRFYEYLVSRQELAASPIPEGWRVKLDRTPKAVPLDGPAVEAVRRAALEMGGTTAVVVVLITDAHLKVGQLCGADVSHFVEDETSGRLSVLSEGFGALRQSIALSDDAAVAVREVIGTRKSGALLRTSYDTPMNQKAVQRHIEKATARAGVPRVTPNDLRRSALSARLGGSIRELRPARIRALSQRAETSEEPTASQVALELLVLSDRLMAEARVRPIAPVVLTGAALEHFLRALAALHGATSEGGGLDRWASALRSLGIITKQEKKVLAVWAGLRDIAVHADQEADLSIRDARAMNTGVREFIEKYRSHLADGRIEASS